MATTGICSHCLSSADHSVMLNRETAGAATPLGRGACVICGLDRLVFPVPAGAALSAFRERKRGPLG